MPNLRHCLIAQFYMYINRIRSLVGLTTGRSNWRARWSIGLLVTLWILIATACGTASPPGKVIVYITATVPATPSPESTLGNVFAPTVTSSLPTPLPIHPTANAAPATIRYMVNQGDTLAVIASAFGISTDALIGANAGLDLTTTLGTGQLINIPNRPSAASVTPDFKIIPDSELVDSPTARVFNTQHYGDSQPGFLRIYSETVESRLMNGPQIVDFLATANSINPRILLALLDYRGGWLSNPVPSADQIDYPLGYRNPDYKGLFKQLSWAASTLNQGYYGWKYRGMRLLRFPDNSRLAFAPDLNAGTVALQYFLSRVDNRAVWTPEVQSGLSGVYAAYRTLFGDPFQYSADPIVPHGLTMPTLQLPFVSGQTWYFTGGPHGGWDAASGWSAIDFAPPSPPDEVLKAQGQCFVSDNYAVSMSAGVVVRSGDGLVEVSLDSTGDPHVGWALIYLHLADQDRIAAGALVQPGTPLGHPSCQGFDLAANATHLHIARLYNGEWVPVDCWGCAPDVTVPPFVIGGWTASGLPAQIYQGMLVRPDRAPITADQGRDVTDNQISW